MQQVVLHTYVVYLQQQYEISSYLHLKPQAKFEEILSTNGTHSLSSYNCGCKYLMTKKFKNKIYRPTSTYISICYWIFK